MGKTESWFWYFAWFITAVAVVGNALVIFLITTKHHLQKKPNWFILSLAIADLFVGFTFIPPFYACWKWFPCSKDVWFVRQTIKWTFLYVSVSNLFTLTLDRYIALTSPLRHKWLVTPTRIALSVITAWIVPVISRVCIFAPVHFSSEATASKYLVPVFLVMFELVPCILLSCFTFHMVYIVRKRRQSSRTIEDSSRELRSLNLRIHIRDDGRANYNIRIVVSVVGLFILCYSLDIYICFCDIFSLSKISRQLWYVRHLLLVTNSALNPIAYALFKRDIRQAILALGRVHSNTRVTPSTENRELHFI
ncbi:histamine H2 receptor-like [Orbicella faveolata]|uniref:histamine H2 receptor-like n=1 Tax=Orbicella faveolata TaxID=48498 RepID=UPI0009E5515D|nr:histamine H2 receptor-like [Orbicella faveolata]